MSKNVLIAGGSGTIGTALTEILRNDNYNVSWLTTSQKQKEGVSIFQWDPTAGNMEEKALQNTDYIINLAGADIGEKKWTRERKKILRESRIKSTELLVKKVSEKNVPLKAFVCASATGYYGYDSGSVEKKEGSRFGDDFLATLVKEWEAAADEFQNIGIRTVKLRTGLVLEKTRGVWPRFEKVIKWGLAAALGSGDQYMSWIHIDDVCRIYKMALESESMTGVYNVVAPNPATNKEFVKTAAKILNKPAFLPNVPSFVMKLMYGELASALLGSSRVSCEKLAQEGFEYRYSNLEDAMKTLVKS